MEQQDVFLMECAACGSTQFELEFGGSVNCGNKDCGQPQTLHHYEPAALELMN